MPGMTVLVNGVVYNVTVLNGTTAILTLSPDQTSVPQTLNVQAQNQGSQAGPSLELEVRWSRADVNCDGVVNAVDVMIVTTAVTGLIPSPTPCQQPLDPDGNGTLNLFDAMYVRRVVAGLVPQ
jgi:hypothetical protein